jgi:hypothetical protein
MKYSVDMGSDVMTYTPAFIKIGSGIQNLVGDRQKDTKTHTEERRQNQSDLINLLLFFQNKKIALKSIKFYYKPKYCGFLHDWRMVF